MKPWKWESDQSNTWYFQQVDATIWIEYLKNKIVAEYEILSQDSDESSYPVIILQDKNRKEIKLTQGIYYKIYFNEFKEYETGFWSSKNSKHAMKQT